MIAAIREVPPVWLPMGGVTILPEVAQWSRIYLPLYPSWIMGKLSREAMSLACLQGEERTD